jgi:hypothetical protein
MNNKGFAFFPLAVFLFVSGSTLFFITNHNKVVNEKPVTPASSVTGFPK